MKREDQIKVEASKVGGLDYRIVNRLYALLRAVTISLPGV